MQRIHITLAAAIVLGTSLSAQAQLSRSEVKAETRAANAKGELPVGERQVVKPQTPSTRTRAERKAETRALAAQGQLPARGESYAPDVSSSTVSTVDRRAVKAETAAANEAGSLMKPGN
jgi:hypothetical protein